MIHDAHRSSDHNHPKLQSEALKSGVAVLPYPSLLNTRQVVLNHVEEVQVILPTAEIQGP